MNRLLAMAPLLALSATNPFALAQSGDPNKQGVTPVSIAGSYLGLIADVSAFKQTKCGYALKKEFPTYSDFVTTEILPLFSANFRTEAQTTLMERLPAVQQQAKVHIAEMLAHAQKETTDERRVCWAVAALLAHKGSRMQEDWNTAKKLHNRK